MSKRQQHERNIQVEFFKYVRYQANRDARFASIIAVPNEGDRGTHLWGKKRKQEGASRGFPDIAVLYPARGYFGAFIELKVRPNRVTKFQAQWLTRLRENGYWSGVAWSLDALIKFTEWYFGDENKS